MRPITVGEKALSVWQCIASAFGPSVHVDLTKIVTD